MFAEGWLTDTQTSYDTVAASYADQVRDLLDQTPYERAFLGLFADMVQAAGGGPVAEFPMTRSVGSSRSSGEYCGPMVRYYSVSTSVTSLA
ncbi:hypothetical protein [Nonomuraea sp. NPDC049695]|uniref:hypothetical protein n=1 Tax=Nonomuraea sp. NPDC049695 TaxID=3154734 RepID=UPI00342E75C3